jgi:hypothetical protein
MKATIAAILTTRRRSLCARSLSVGLMGGCCARPCCGVKELVLSCGYLTVNYD